MTSVLFLKLSAHPTFIWYPDCSGVVNNENSPSSKFHSILLDSW